MEYEKKLKALYSELSSEYLNNIEPYWCTYGPDLKNGGFIGEVNHKNLPNYDAHKGCILNSRILWTFSKSFKQFGTKESEMLAKKAFHFFIKHFVDEQNGGVFWEIDSKGYVSDSRKHVYAQSFAIYGLTEYYSAFGDLTALKIAKSIFNIVEEKCYDPVHEGYFEAFTNDWQINDDVRLSEKDANEPKSMNTHLHVLEAYTNLYRYAPSNEIKNRILSIVSIFLDKILTEDSRSFHCFFSENWSPKSQIISFGHDIETTWLLTEALEVINVPIDSEFITVIKLVADHVHTYGMDPDGGLINEINLDTSENDYSKDWWPQAEALVGFYNAYQLTGDSKYLNSVFKSWEFIKAFIIDHESGEWFEKVTRKGLAQHKLNKIRAWKAPYHNSRAIFELRDRIKKTLELTTSKVPVGLWKNEPQS